MKKVLSIIAALSIVTSLTACGSGTQPEPSESITASQVETEEVKETENDSQVIDPFETLSINTDYNTLTVDIISDVYSHYPSAMMMSLDYGEKDYSSMITYAATIISSDDKAINVEVYAELKPSYAESYSLSSDTKSFEIKVSDIPSHLLNNEMLSAESSEQLEKHCRTLINDPSSIDNRETGLLKGVSDMSGSNQGAAVVDETALENTELVSVFECLPSNTSFLSDQKVIEKGEYINPKYNATGIPFVEDEKKSEEFRVFYVYKINDKYSIISACPVFLNDQLIIDHTSVKTLAFGMTDNTFDSKEAAISAIESWVSNYSGVELTEIAK